MRRTAVGAFGITHPVCWLAIDAVAMAVRDELQRSGMTMRQAVNMALAFWPEWTTALAKVEHEGEPWLFVVAETLKGWWCASMVARELPEGLRHLPIEAVPRRMFIVNMPHLLIEMRERAKQTGLDLSGGHFIVPADHPELATWMADVRDRRKVSTQQFDPLRLKLPPSRSLQRGAFEAMSWTIH
jgi:hypothetical protein